MSSNDFKFKWKSASVSDVYKGGGNVAAALS